MPTLSQLISTIQNAPDRGQVPNRARNATKRQITGWINEVRGYLITKTIEKGDSFPVTFQQNLGCWPLETVDQADIGCPYKWGDNVKKAIIPEVMEIDNNQGIFLFLIDQRTQIYLPSQMYGSLDDYTRFPLKGSQGYQAQIIGNQIIYIKINNSGDTPPINVFNPRGIFKDPTLISYYNQQGEKYCYDPDKDPYPIPGDLEGTMYEIIWQRYIAPFVGLSRDSSNQESNKAAI